MFDSKPKLSEDLKNFDEFSSKSSTSPKLPVRRRIFDSPTKTKVTQGSFKIYLYQKHIPKVSRKSVIEVNIAFSYFANLKITYNIEKISYTLKVI